jgi:hypothetical protein
VGSFGMEKVPRGRGEKKTNVEEEEKRSKKGW